MNHRSVGVSFVGFALLLNIARHSTFTSGLTFDDTATLMQWLLFAAGIGYLLAAELRTDHPRKP